MNTTLKSVSSALLDAPYQLNIWFGSFLWLLGNFGTIGNVIIYSHRSYRQRAYGIYLLGEAISDFIYIDFLLLTRILQNGFQISITGHYNFICKIRQFDSVWNPLVSLTLFTFAIIDRILSVQRSNKYRQWSNRVKLSYKICIAIPLFWLVFFAHRLILYNIRNGSCNALPGFYASFDSYVEAGFTALGVPLAMAILAFFLLRSIRSVTQGKVVPVNNNQPIATTTRSNLQQIDSQVAFMLLLQIAISILTRIPYVAQVLYSNITQYWSKSELHIAIENTVIEFIRILSYVFFTTSFYVSIITNGRFRRQVKGLFQKKQVIDHTTQ
ncbi:unnamed protein product [Adineta steineri]|uniref:G-protein coupled receptors family 1 profile domain-containing protein n=1 Tax=Adineta steineri TaxID=433720 RepID=A0A815L8U7_9BILA|nr:unnamed protein product [Adineta steineri]